MNKPIDRLEYARREQWRCAAHFAAHELLDERYWDDGRGARWLIGVPGTFVYRTEIIAGIGGSLVVHGDIDLVRFAHYGDHADAWSRLCWMGACRDIDYYVGQKAGIGSGHRLTDYDEDVARHDLTWHLEQRDNAPEIREALERAREHADHRDAVREILGEVSHVQDSWEWLGEIGEVVAFRVVNAHAALHRCMHLLAARYGWEGSLATPAVPTHFCPFLKRDEKGDPIPLRAPRALPPDSPVAKMSVEQRRECVEARVLVDGILYARDVP
jgi:hypothetical protein